MTDYDPNANEIDATSFTGERTDLERVREMLTRAGVVFEERSDAEDLFGEAADLGVAGAIKVVASSSDHNIGYTGFFAELLFGADGMLVAVGAWE
jgi:hypothetical protein